VAALVLTAIVGYRVFAPTETVDAAKTAYPASAPTARPKVYGTLLASPIVVDGRLRVYAAARQVYADLPVDVKSSMSPFWSYRRWPAQVLGVVASGTTVVSQWSDGELVAIDATRGRVAWRANLPVPSGLGFTGRRTGAQTVYHPPYLLTAGDTVIAVGADATAGYQAATGRQLWRRAGACSDAFTGPDLLVCAGKSTVDAMDAATGEPRPWTVADPQPLDCVVGRSGCSGVRTAGNAWLIGAQGGLTAAPAAVDPASWLAGDAVLTPGPAGVVASRPDGSPLWTWPGGAARILAVEPGAVHVLIADQQLSTLDPATGRELSRYPFVVEASTAFDLGQIYAADRFLFIERLRPGAKPSDKDGTYYYPSPNVIVAGS
jgi:hypothetical protein